MNIFALDLDPKTAARYHVDKHVLQMSRESLQMMSTCVNMLGGKGGDPEVVSKSSPFPNHPCTIWVRESSSNFRWLKQLAWELCLEGYHRYGNRWSNFDRIKDFPDLDVPDIGLTPFAQAMPDECKHADGITAYRRYYQHPMKKHLLKWKRRPAPPWMSRDAVGFSVYTNRAITKTNILPTKTCTPDDPKSWPKFI